MQKTIKSVNKTQHQDWSIIFHIRINHSYWHLSSKNRHLWRNISSTYQKCICVTIHHQWRIPTHRILRGKTTNDINIRQCIHITLASQLEIIFQENQGASSVSTQYPLRDMIHRFLKLREKITIYPLRDHLSIKIESLYNSKLRYWIWKCKNQHYSNPQIKKTASFHMLKYQQHCIINKNISWT